jgi:CPA1 family monovalent cation:H+ antiporter
MTLAAVPAEQVEQLVLLLIVSLVVVLIARQLRFPYTLALVLVGLLMGVLPFIPTVQFNPEVVLFVFIPALLFEGAWNISVTVVLKNWLAVLLLAVPGLLISLLVVAVALHFGTGLTWLEALLLGAIISPTDPVAVVALFRQLRMGERMRTIIEGESLFNDGVGAAVYTVVLGLLLVAVGHTTNAANPVQVSLSAVWLFLGGPLIGLVLGFLIARLLRHFDDHLIEMTITFSAAYGIYLLGDLLHTSGLLAVVVAGLILGSFGRQRGMSERSRAVVDEVWEFIGYIANSLLFLLLGMQIGSSHIGPTLAPLLWAIAGVIVGRALMIFLLFTLHDAIARWYAHYRRDQRKSLRSSLLPVPRSWRPIILLSGLRGALSLALVLSLPHDLPNIGLFEFVTYGVVLVTLVGQGIAMRAILPGWSARHEPIEMALEMPTMSQSPDAPDAPEESPG